MKHLKVMCIGLCATMILVGCASKQQDPEQAELKGFLGDYSQLESVDDKGGGEIRRWVTSENIKGKYPKLMVDQIVFYPKPQPGEQVSEQTLTELGRYTELAISRELSKSYQLVKQAGPDVARVRIALTGVVTEVKGLKPYEYLPFAAIAAGVSTAAGIRDRKAFLLVEGEVTDSVTGEKLGLSVHKIPSKKLLENDEEQLTVDMLKPAIDEKAQNVRLMFDHVLK